MPESHTGCASDVDWQITQQLLDEHGYAKIPNLLSKTQCQEIIDTYEEESYFRTTIEVKQREDEETG